MGRPLTEEMRLHMAEPFPYSVEKRMEYGSVDAVMIGADIYGWATRAGDRESPSDRWSGFQRSDAVRFRDCVTEEQPHPQARTGTRIRAMIQGPKDSNVE